MSLNLREILKLPPSDIDLKNGKNPLLTFQNSDMFTF